MFCQSDAGNILWRDDKEQALPWTPLYLKNAAQVASKIFLPPLNTFMQTEANQTSSTHVVKIVNALQAMNNGSKNTLVIFFPKDTSVARIVKKSNQQHPNTSLPIKACLMD